MGSVQLAEADERPADRIANASAPASHSIWVGASLLFLLRWPWFAQLAGLRRPWRPPMFRVGRVPRNGLAGAMD